MTHLCRYTFGCRSMIGCAWSLQKAISDLVNTCKGLVVVCVNRDVAFHGGRGDLGTIANKVSEICKAAALVTENDRLWRVAHALTGKNYKIPGSSNLQHFLLKRLLVEKPIDVVAPSNAFVRELEETCINEPGLRFNIPKNMEESKVKFEYKPTFTAQSKRKQERQDEGHGGIDVSDQRLRWYSVTELSELICELCVREMQMNKSKVLGSNSKIQSHFLRELLRELECGYERCCEINRREEAVAATFRRMRGCNPRSTTSHGGRQQCSGHDHDYTGTCIFQAEEGAIPRGFREHDNGSGSTVLQ